MPCLERSTKLDCQIGTSNCQEPNGHYNARDISIGSSRNVSDVRMFLGTNNIIGIAHDDTVILGEDIIVTVPGRQRALALRPWSDDSDHWYICGTVIIYYPQLHHTVRVSDYVYHDSQFDETWRSSYDVRHVLYCIRAYLRADLQNAGRTSDTWLHGWSKRNPLEYTKVFDNNAPAAAKVFKLECQPLYFHQLMQWGLFPGEVSTHVSPHSQYRVMQEQTYRKVSAPKCRHHVCLFRKSRALDEI